MRDTQRLGLKFKLLSNIFDCRMNQKVAEYDLTSTQSLVLGYLVRSEGPLFQKDIEKRFNMKHPTVTGIIQRLEDKGFIECSVDEKDRRYKVLRPTQKSLDFHRRTTMALAQTNDELSAALSDEEVQALQALLDQLLEGAGLPHPDKGKEEPTK
jgi:MarR family transcriptional repressor of mepA